MGSYKVNNYSIEKHFEPGGIPRLIEILLDEDFILSEYYEKCNEYDDINVQLELFQKRYTPDEFADLMIQITAKGSDESSLSFVYRIISAFVREAYHESDTPGLPELPFVDWLKQFAKKLAPLFPIFSVPLTHSSETIRNDGAIYYYEWATAMYKYGILENSYREEIMTELELMRPIIRNMSHDRDAIVAINSVLAWAQLKDASRSEMKEVLSDFVKERGPEDLFLGFSHLLGKSYSHRAIDLCTMLQQLM